MTEGRKEVIAVDFDGCLCENRWPEIGEPNVPAIEELKARQQAGAKIILWTCRAGERLDEAVKACESWGIVFDAVNEPLPEQIEKFGNDARKIFADEYWDDKAIPEWYGKNAITDAGERAIEARAVTEYGRMAQMIKAIEELAELQQALARELAGSLSNVDEEMADVEVMLDQLKMIYKNNDMVASWKTVKLLRLEQRLNGK